MPAFHLKNIEMKDEDSWDEFLEELKISQEICAQGAMYYFGLDFKERQIEDGLESLVYSLFQKYCDKFCYTIGRVSYSETRAGQEELAVHPRTFGHCPMCDEDNVSVASCDVIPAVMPRQ